ncbi:MAG: NAD(P)/FAD-dependent oxidoreductase [Thermoanaerobaculia bacterium]
MSEPCDVAVVGSGFAGSILARALAVAGRCVVLLERGSHPRFALGESSTPLAAIALERLAECYGLDDLRSLAAYGRWERDLPHLGHGLKRGFTFLDHRPGGRSTPAGPSSEGRGVPAGAGRSEAGGRLLVAASPSDEVADSHWLRSDVDAHLVERADSAGVDYRDRVELREARVEDGAVVLRGDRDGRSLELRAGFVVDASGGARFLGRHLGIPEAEPPSRVATGLLAGHFEGVVPLDRVADPADLGPPGPYPDERAAVHHLLEEGWMYLLPFDGYETGGRVSAGIELAVGGGLAHRPGGGDAGPSPKTDPEGAFRAITARYPTLAAQLAGARAVAPVRYVPRLQYRLARAAGRRWLLLPHAYAFTSPLFSSGMAWSLVAVERAARMLEGGEPGEGDLARYDALLAAEADWIDRLVAGAFRAMPRFGLFAPWTLLYFAAASYAEAAQRLLDGPAQRPLGRHLHRPGEELAGGGPEAWCWDGFLGCRDPVLRRALEEAERHLEGALAAGTLEGDAAFAERVLAAIRERDLCGFDRAERRGLHPVDLDVLVARADRLGLDRGAIRSALPRLRGEGGPARF